MPKCLAHNCCNSSASASERNISFHRLPGSINKKRQWLLAIKRDPEETYSSLCVICSEHFLPQDFVMWGPYKRLKSTVVPSQNLPQSEMKKGKHRSGDYCGEPPVDLSEGTPADDQSCYTDLAISSASDDTNPETKIIKEDMPVVEFLFKSDGSPSRGGTSDMKLEYQLIPSHEITIESPKSSGSSASSSIPKKRKRVMAEEYLWTLDESLDKAIDPGKKKRLVKMMHSYSHSPSQIEKQLQISEEKCYLLRGQLHNEKKKVNRLRKKVYKLQQVILSLKKHRRN